MSKIVLIFHKSLPLLNNKSCWKNAKHEKPLVQQTLDYFMRAPGIAADDIFPALARN